MIHHWCIGDIIVPYSLDPSDSTDSPTVKLMSFFANRLSVPYTVHRHFHVQESLGFSSSSESPPHWEPPSPPHEDAA